MFKEEFMRYDCDTLHRKQAIFSSIFILQNRMQTAGDKIEPQISMKQWLLLAMTECCPEPRTLTNVGNLMGCSRQNIKKLALALEEKGFVRLVLGSNNSIHIKLTEKAKHYENEIGHQQKEVMQLLFSDFNEVEVKQLFKLYGKLYLGVERVENYVEELN